MGPPLMDCVRNVKLRNFIEPLKQLRLQEQRPKHRRYIIEDKPAIASLLDLCRCRVRIWESQSKETAWCNDDIVGDFRGIDLK